MSNLSIFHKNRKLSLAHDSATRRLSLANISTVALQTCASVRKQNYKTLAKNFDKL